jgi:rare lipoprotein A (peptidoglycan hydrolase)
MVEVYSVKWDKKVIVKVNDTMGNNSAAIIDLSYKAAEEIGLNIDGRTDVTVRVITAEEK